MINLKKRKISKIAWQTIIILIIALFIWGYSQEYYFVNDEIFISPLFISPLGVNANIKVTSQKTGWDLLELIGVLAVPIAVGFGVFWLNNQQQEQAQKLAKGQEEERILQSYLEAMTELLFEKNLRKSEEWSEVRSVARVRTLAVLREVNETRKTSVMRFILESELIGAQTALKLKGREIEVDIRRNIINLSGANLSYAYLSGAGLWGADLNHANLKETDLSFADLSGADLGRANLRGAGLWRANLRGANLRGANLVETDLRGANLSHAYLSGANLVETDLSHANLSHAYLSGANLSYAYLSGAGLWRANLRGANLRGAYLSGANLVETDLNHANLKETDLSFADLSGADLSFADLRETNLLLVNLIRHFLGINLSKTKLGETKLFLASQRGTSLSKARYNDKTTWPEDFDPKKAGAVNVDEETEI